MGAGFTTDVPPDGARGHFEPPAAGEIAELFPQLEISEMIGKGAFVGTNSSLVAPVSANSRS